MQPSIVPSELSDDEIHRFANACADPDNVMAPQVMLAAGANSATGVLAKLLLATSDERRRLIALIRTAISG